MTEENAVVNSPRTRMLAMIGGCAVVAMGALGFAVSQERTGDATTLNSEMTTGVTVTQSVAPENPPVSVAVPEITGPAKLPPEEQGLPG